jgi:Ferritin-like
MIRLQRALSANLDTHDGLTKALQQAIELEHATIPTYIYALYSIKPGANLAIAGLVRSIVLEEMLHMSLACNILNAVGGSPIIDNPKFIPTYPGRLPGSVETELIVPLARFTVDLVANVFMVIEEPEDPLNFPVKPLELAPAAPLTIGSFYREIEAQIKAQGEAIFTGDPKRQVTHAFPAAELFAVTDVNSAVKAIELIVEQGEGTKRSPLDQEHELAHYYRFAEIYHGRTLERDPSAPDGFSYSGPPIPFDPAGVWPAILNPKTTTYPAGTKGHNACLNFNYGYTSLLKSLHATFNGQPGQLPAAIGLMESLKEQAINMMEIELGDGTNAGPSFEYQPVNS